MRCSIKRRVLPNAPTPTKPKEVKEVQGLAPKHLEVRKAKPAVTVNVKRRRRTPSKAIMESAKKRTEEKQQRKAKAIELYKSGWTFQEIAEHLGVKMGAVYDYTRDIRMSYGYKRESKYAQYFDEAEKLYKQGATYTDIGEQLGLTRAQVDTVIQDLRNNGRVGRRNKWTSRRRL